MVTVANGNADNPGGAGGAAGLPVRQHRAGHRVQAPDVLHVVDHASSARSRGASRWKPRTSDADGPLPASASATSTSCCRARCRPIPASTSRHLRPYKGYGAIRLTENAGDSKYNSFQLSADRRYSNGFKLGARLHALEVGGQRQRQAQRDVEHLRRHELLGRPRASTVATCSSSTTSTTCRSCASRRTLMSNLLGGWQISGSSFFRTGTPFSVLRTNDIAGVGDGGHGQPYNLVGDVDANANKEFSAGAGNGHQLLLQPGCLRRAGGRHLRQRAEKPALQPGRAAVGHRAVQELQRWAAARSCSSAPSSSTSSTTRTGAT